MCRCIASCHRDWGGLTSSVHPEMIARSGNNEWFQKMLRNEVLFFASHLWFFAYCPVWWSRLAETCPQPTVRRWHLLEHEADGWCFRQPPARCPAGEPHVFPARISHKG